ncbi:unnamed protein product [Enterobius vermicularis]|uniref:Nucleolar protein 14 n=1 Tax=Enterobius vermicularis TaxID=51028 RepID=A0A158Q987_ENTVE|nr:unnamed protein product [Enterobius vermicularis]
MDECVITVQVLGKTRNAVIAGKPTLSKKRAMENRLNTLGAELRQFGKTNKVLDRRLGVNDRTVSEEEKVSKRFIAERLRRYEAKDDLGDSKNEDDILTHKGSALTSIQKYDRAFSDDDDDDEDEVDANTVSLAHFGGGSEPTTVESEDRNTRRKNVLAELIAKQKQQRFEKRMARDELESATDRLDEKWRKLMQKGGIGNLMGTGKKTNENQLPDDYDTLARQSQSVDEIIKKKSQKSEVFEAVYDADGKLINADKVQKPRIKIVRVENESSDETVSMTDEMEGENEEETLDQMVKEDNESASALKDAGPSHQFASLVMPDAYNDLKNFLRNKSAEEIAPVISQLVDCYQPNLREGNKKKLARLMLYLIRFYDDLAIEGPNQIEKLAALHKSIFHLLKFNSDYGARCLRAVIRQQRKQYVQSLHKIFEFRIIALVTLVQKLFPVSDVFHPVCTPTYLPEVVAYLRGIFLVSVEHNEDEKTPTATFPISSPHRTMLLVKNDCSNLDEPLVLEVKKVFSADDTEFKDNDYNKLCVLRAALAATSAMVSTYSTHIFTFSATFGPFLKLFSRLPKQNYPKVLREEIENLESAILATCKTCSPLQQLHRTKKEIKMLEMLEPRFEPHFNAERKHSLRKDKDPALERRVLKRKIKSATRDAVKELRRDNQFLALSCSNFLPLSTESFITFREKRRQIAEDDRIRKRKTRKLLRELQGQESEYKKSLYMKKKG